MKKLNSLKTASLKRLSVGKGFRRGPADRNDTERPRIGEGSLISARRIELSGQWGQVFGPLDLDVNRGGVTLIEAPPGAARTAFLMALCGRMKIKSGRLTVLGHTNAPHAVFKESNIACFDELDEPQPSVTVQDLITEQIRWESGFFKWVPLATTEELKKMCGYLFEGLTLPPIDAFLADLPELHQLLLRIGVANTRRPPLLVVGRFDAMSDAAQQIELLDRLVMLGEKQSVITADVNASELEDRVSEVVEVPGLFEFHQRIRAARDLATESHPDSADDEPANSVQESDEGRDSSGDPSAVSTVDETSDSESEGETKEVDAPPRSGGAQTS